MHKRLSKGEKKNAKRMATVAAVYTTNPFQRSPEDLVSETGPRIKNLKRPPIENKRVWASIEKMPEDVIEEAFAEARNRDPDYEKSGWHWLTETKIRSISCAEPLLQKVWI